jgi:hypothetical protein
MEKKGKVALMKILKYSYLKPDFWRLLLISEKLWII